MFITYVLSVSLGRCKIAVMIDYTISTKCIGWLEMSVLNILATLPFKYNQQ